MTKEAEPWPAEAWPTRPLFSELSPSLHKFHSVRARVSVPKGRVFLTFTQVTCPPSQPAHMSTLVALATDTCSCPGVQGGGIYCSLPLGWSLPNFCTLTLGPCPNVPGTLWALLLIGAGLGPRGTPAPLQGRSLEVMWQRLVDHNPPPWCPQVGPTPPTRASAAHHGGWSSFPTHGSRGGGSFREDSGEGDTWM